MISDLLFTLLLGCGLAYLIIGYLIENGVINFDRYYARQARKKIERDIYNYKRFTR